MRKLEGYMVSSNDARSPTAPPGAVGLMHYILRRDVVAQLRNGVARLELASDPRSDPTTLSTTEACPGQTFR